MRAHPYAIAKIAFITARIIVSLDFTSAVHHMIHFIHHFIVNNCLHKKKKPLRSTKSSWSVGGAITRI